MPLSRPRDETEMAWHPEVKVWHHSVFVTRRFNEKAARSAARVLDAAISQDSWFHDKEPSQPRCDLPPQLRLADASAASEKSVYSWQ